MNENGSIFVAILPFTVVRVEEHVVPSFVLKRQHWMELYEWKTVVSLERSCSQMRGEIM